MSVNPAEDEYANQCLKLWGACSRLYGPRAYPRQAAFVPRARGQDIDADTVVVEVVGRVVADLHHQDRDVVCKYYKPGPDGKCCSVRAVCRDLGLNHKTVSRIIDRCIGRVAQAIKMCTVEVY